MKMILSRLSLSIAACVFTISCNDVGEQLVIEEPSSILYHQSLASAPEIIKQLVTSLGNPERFGNAMPQRLLLVGPPGVGKTTLAKAIAHASGRSLVSIDAPFVANEYKNSGAQNLMHIFQEVISSGLPTVVIIDELTCLTQNYKDPHNPDTNSAEALWLCLDACKNNPEILVIGTTNDASQMPEQLKSRFDGCVVEIPLGDTISARKEIFRHHLKKWRHRLSEKDLETIASKSSGFSVRHIDQAVRQAALFALLRVGGGDILSLQDCEQAIILIRKSQKLMQPSMNAKYKEWAWQLFTIAPTALSIVYWLITFYKMKTDTDHPNRHPGLAH